MINENQTLELVVEDNEMTKLIKQAYATTMAKHRLDVHQMRIMLRILEALQPQMKFSANVADIDIEKENRIFVFKAKDLLPAGSKHHDQLRKALKGLTNKESLLEGKPRVV